MRDIRQHRIQPYFQNLFLPEFTYDGVELISPFYYVNFKNRVNAYLILPEIKVSLIAESGSQTNIVIQNNPTLFITIPISKS